MAMHQHETFHGLEDNASLELYANKTSPMYEVTNVPFINFSNSKIYDLAKVLGRFF